MVDDDDDDDDEKSMDMLFLSESAETQKSASATVWF